MDDSMINSWEDSKQRWDVMEDFKALYIIRYMSGLYIKDVTEHVEFPSVDKGISLFIIYLMHYKWFILFYFLITVIIDCGSVLQYPPAILVLKYVGKVGSDDRKAYPGYTVYIDLPGTFYKTSAVKIDLDVKCKVLKITIPKKEGKSNDKISCKTKIDKFKHLYPYEVFGDRERSRTKLGWSTRFLLIVWAYVF